MSTANIHGSTPYQSPHTPSFSDVQGDDFPYRAISRSAVASVVLFFAALIGWLLWPALVLAVVGLIMGIWAIRSIRAYPEEFSGSEIAKFGLIANAVLLVTAIGYHSYVYATEVPDGYTRVQFYDLQPGDGRGDSPTEVAREMSGEQIFLKGYIHPTSGSGQLKRFILVPDMGTCCFGGQPKSTDMVDVTLGGGQTITSNVLKKRLAGKFYVLPVSQKIPGFDNGLFYRFKVDIIR